MNSKICPTCQEEKEISEFYHKKDRKNGSSTCKLCFSRYCMKRWVQRKIDAINYKGGSCIDCGVTHPEYPYVIFDFHHLNPKEKDVDWAKLKLRSWDKVIEELDKCVLLCSNCHRIRHYE